jgi:restriction system-associated AAA family ATPase
MKLLKLTIQNTQGFRSLQQGFSINFHNEKNSDAMQSFSPFCFAGLNGSGKSNVLEAIAHIFFHLELCVAKYLPDSIKKIENFNPKDCNPDAFTIEYLIGQHNRKQYIIPTFDKVIIRKQEGKAPIMKVQSYPFGKKDEIRKVSLIPPKSRDTAAEGKTYLPAHIIGYSSGENEILSLPFIKSRLIHFDEYKQATADNYFGFNEPENSLIYIDNNMSQAVLLACLLFEDNDTLAPLRDIDNTGILGLKSFRINIQPHNFNFLEKRKAKFLKPPITASIKTKDVSSKPILDLIEDKQIRRLKECATSWFQDPKTKTIWIDFFVNDATKKAFRKNFSSSLECFQLFSLLYELNNHFIDEVTKEKIYQSKGVYTDWKLPVGTPEQDVFHFLDYYVTKEIKGTKEKKDLLLRSFSNGEHQFIHTMGICLLLKDRRSLLLLDEPETHFNPSWRAKFIKILNDSISKGNPKNLPNGDYNVHLLKDILLTSHSPFIISDCLPDNVILFEKDKQGKTTAKKVSEIDKGFNTYGTSVELILDKLFNYRQSIGDLANAELKNVDFTNLTKEKVSAEKDKLRKLGESIEKDMVLARLNRIEMQPKNNA